MKLTTTRKATRRLDAQGIDSFRRHQLREYKRLHHKLGWTTLEAWRAATINALFQAAEDDELVMLQIDPDESADLENLEGDSYSPECNPDIKPEILRKERDHFLWRINNDGVWGMVGKVKCRHCDNWETVDSVWGFVGDDWKDSVYDTDIKLACLQRIGWVQ